MLGRCLCTFSCGWQMIMVVLLMMGLTACSTLQQPEKKAGFSPPDIDQRVTTSGKQSPPFVDSDRLVLEKGIAEAVESTDENQDGSGIDPLFPSGDGLGIKITGIRWSAAGYMLHFRYKVISPAEALPMFDRSIVPYLIHEKSGARFAVPNPAKVGPLRTTGTPETGRIYYTMFANPGRYVQQGDLVAVVVGDYRFEHLIVE